MLKICFLGAGSTVFAKNVLGDCLYTEALNECEIALYDIDGVRLEESFKVISAINKGIPNSKAKIVSYTDTAKFFSGARYVINAIQVGGYKPSTVIDFDIPKKYGLKQTIGDTLGIGGIFRGLRTIPVMLEYAHLMEKYCPDAYLLNYTNPMASITGGILEGSGIKTVGLCHSVQVCVPSLFDTLKIDIDPNKTISKIAGINHMAWLLELTDMQGNDLYPMVKDTASKMTEKHNNMVRLDIMKHFGYYITESSEHLSEYLPYYIKDKYPEFIEKYNIPLDEYPRRCIEQIAKWGAQRENLLKNDVLDHKRSHEYGSYIINAIETNEPTKIGGNVKNKGLITNLPSRAIVEVPCLIDGSGINPTYVGDIPQQLAALNTSNINVSILTVEAALTQKKEHIYHAAMVDPHTSSELSIDEIKSMCDDLIEAHGDYLPKYK